MAINPEDKLNSGNSKQVPNPSSLEGGDSAESLDDSSRDSSQRLRHKGRSVSFWDYERLVLEEFPAVYKVGAFVGAVTAVVIIAWMISDIKGPRDRLGQEPVIAIETSTTTPLPTSSTAIIEAGDPAGLSTPTATPAPTSTSAPTSTPTLQPIEINFNADSYSIVQGECTTLRWQVSGAESVLVEGVEAEHTEAEQVCPSTSTGYTLIAENLQESKESHFVIEVTAPTATDQPLGCTGYDQNGQLVCKETCTDNDPAEQCSLK